MSSRADAALAGRRAMRAVASDLQRVLEAAMTMAECSSGHAERTQSRLLVRDLQLAAEHLTRARARLSEATERRRGIVPAPPPALR